MELLIGLGIVLQQLAGFKLRSIRLCEIVHHINEVGGAELIHISERAAAERRKRTTTNKTDVSCDRAFDNSILQAFDSFIDEPIRD